MTRERQREVTVKQLWDGEEEEEEEEERSSGGL